MYCILSQSNDIVASDLEFLNLLGTTSLVDLYKKITSEDVKISLDYDKITLTINNNAQSYDIKTTPLTTLFGKSVLVQLMSVNIKSEFIKAPNFNDQSQNNTKKTVTKVEIVTKQPTEVATAQPTKNEPIIESGFDLENLKDMGIYANEPEKTKDKGSLGSFIDPKVTIDIPSIAKSMHLSDKEYSIFLNEYTSSVEEFKKDLLGSDKKAKENAINFIKHITTALNMPNNIDTFVNSLSIDSSKESFENFFNVIENIKEQNNPVSSKPKEESQIEQILKTETSDDKLESIDIMESTEPINEIKLEAESIAQETIPSIDINEPLEIDLMGDVPSENKIEETPSKSSGGKTAKIDLSKVKPLPFDFILEESAKELSLPNDIVKEFIKDFIEQCNADTNKIISKYEEGNIEKVKKLAHSLKGVASNLYIMPLANSLLDLQNNDDLSEVKPLVEKYWGQFLYLENIMKNI